MKRTINNIIFLITVFYIAGCSTDEADKSFPDGILIDVKMPLIDGWNTKINNYTRNDATIKKSEKEENGFNIVIGTGVDTISTGLNNTTTRWTNIDDNTTFRVIAYDCNSASDISTSNYKGYGDYRLLSGNTVETIKSLVLPTGTYTFVCYSYGDSSIMEPFSNTSTNTIATNGQNFMTCIKQGITINNIIGSKYLLDNVIFIHRCARYVISIEAQEGRISNVTACSGTLTLPNKSATYSFETDAFITTDSTPYELLLTWNNPNDISVRSNYTYVIPFTSRNVEIKLNSTVGGRLFSNKAFSFTNQTFNSGTAYCSHISFKITEGYLVGGTVWAPGNLYYDGTNFKNYTNTLEYSSDRSIAYWHWGALYPGVLNSGYTVFVWDENDPCKRVNPVGTWRLPSTDNFRSLIEKEPIRYETLNDEVVVVFGNTLLLPTPGIFVYDMSSEPKLRGSYWSRERKKHYSDKQQIPKGDLMDTGYSDYHSGGYNTLISGVEDEFEYFFTIRCIKEEE